MKINFRKSILLAAVICLLIAMPLTAKAQNDQLVATVENDQAYLHLTGPDSFTLKFKGVSGNFNWPSDSARYNEPIMRVFDYDNDGQKEVAIALCVGTGTGLHLEELHIVKTENSKLADYACAAQEYEKLIADNVLCNIVNEQDKMLVKLSSAKSNITIDITGYAKDYEAKPADIAFYYGDVIYFQLKNDGIIEFEAPLAIKAQDTWDIFYIAQLTAKVVFSNGKFSITDVQLKEDK